MYDLRSLTYVQLVRLYRRVWDRATRGDGYQPFGYDRPTMRLTKPGWLAILDAIYLEDLRRLHS